MRTTPYELIELACGGAPQEVAKSLGKNPRNSLRLGRRMGTIIEIKDPEALNGAATIARQLAGLALDEGKSELGIVLTGAAARLSRSARAQMATSLAQ